MQVYESTKKRECRSISSLAPYSGLEIRHRHTQGVEQSDLMNVWGCEPVHCGRMNEHNI